MNIKTLASVLFFSAVILSQEAQIAGGLREQKITEISSITKLEEHIDEKPYLSYLKVEIAGTYEGNPSKKDLVAQLVSTSSSGTQVYSELKLYTVNTTPEELRADALAIAAVSKPTPFKVTILVQPSGWTGKTLFYDGPQSGKWWTITAKSTRYTPVNYDHKYGFTAILYHTAAKKDWSFTVFGLK